MKRNREYMKSHTMELPRLIEIGERNIGKFGTFLHSLTRPKCVSLISGSNVQRILQRKIEGSLAAEKIHYTWHTTKNNQRDSLDNIQDDVKKDRSDVIVGIGGGLAVDTAKWSSWNLKIPFVSVPTAASHDGMASPFVSIKSDKPYSQDATAPLGVFVDIDVIKKAPKQLLSSGCGDLIANIVAVKDWQLGHKKIKEYYGRYSAELAMMSARMIVENSNEFAKNGIDTRMIVEGLISAGVAACIAGSSRPCSGSEHLFSHALDIIAPEKGLHGEKCGIGAIMMSKLHRQDWRSIKDALKNVGAPTTAKEIDLEPKDVVNALQIAQGLRPKRYTILKEINMTERKALNLAKSTSVI